jgi:hypothetical protein
MIAMDNPCIVVVALVGEIIKRQPQIEMSELCCCAEDTLTAALCGIEKDSPDLLFISLIGKPELFRIGV